MGLSGLNNFGVLFGLFALVALIFVAKAVQRLTVITSELQARARDEEALRQVAHALTGTFSLDDVLPRISESISSAGRAESVFVELIDEAKDEMTCVAGYGPGVPAPGTRGHFRGSLAEEVLNTREPRIIRDVSLEAERRSAFGVLARTCQNCTALVVPLVVENQRLGSVFLIRRQPEYFRHDEFPRVKILADMASLAIQRAVTVDRLQAIQRREHFLAEAAAILASSLDYRETLRSVVQLTVPRIADWSALYLREEGIAVPVEVMHADPQKLKIARRLQEKYPPPKEGDTAVIRVIRSGKPELFPEVSDEMLQQAAQSLEHLELLRKLRIGSGMILPLLAGRETYGALTFFSEKVRNYSAEDLTFAEELTRQAASAIQNARLYRAAERAIKVRDEVLRVVSHDLRNPIHNVHMTATLLGRTKMSEEKRRDMLDIIRRSADRMDRMIEDLLAISRVREGHPIPLDVRPRNPGEMLDEACRIFQVQASSKSINLQCEQSTELPLVQADSHRVLQVLSNLLDNAIKFTAEGGSIVLRCQPHGNDVMFCVQDTGRGIEQEHLDKIFDLFWQAKSTAHMGSGFGLAIAKSIVEQHGGRIWVESLPGSGTTFFFTLPSVRSQEDEGGKKVA